MDLLKMPGVVYCEFEKNSYIIQQGEKVDYLYYLVSGSCQRIALTEKGNEMIYGVKESNDMLRSLLGVLIIFYRNETSTSSFIATSKCSCYKISKETFMEYVKDKPELLIQLVHMAMLELQELNNTFQARHEGKQANRLCGFLLHEAQIKQDKLVVDKHLTNVAISRFLGIHKVTVAKILKVLKDEGIIIKENGVIFICDEKKLLKYANAEIPMGY